MEKITLVINGNQIQVGQGASLLQAARSADIYIPSLCSYPGLRPLSEVAPDRACQLCLVEVEGEIVLSCSTKASEGMKVETETPRIRELRKRKLFEILRRHPVTCYTCQRKELCEPFDTCLRTVSVQERCAVCPANGICELQQAVDYIGVTQPPPYIPKDLPILGDNPFFIRDHNYCILCERCVRVCEEIRGIKAIEHAFPCHRACPAGIDIPRYIGLVGLGKPAAALGVIREKVPFPGSLGRVCIHPCEGQCQRGKVIDHPLFIRMMKRFAADHGGDSWKKLVKKFPPTGKKVAVVGAGPAGLTAALYLAKLGHKVTVFEALPKAGGMLRVGIPSYRLPRDILDGEIEDIINAGVEIKLNTRIESAEALFNEGYNAVFLGLGAHEGMKIGVPGEDVEGVIESAIFLRRANLGEKVDVGERVGVIGGGNVAIDAARYALRLGAKKVTIFYRRTRAEMPASPEEVDAALEEGVEIAYLVAPSKITRENGVLKLECTRAKLGEPDASGRARPITIEGSEFITEIDTLIAAIGQRPLVAKAFQVELQKGNIIKIGPDMQTNQKGVYAGGDCVDGPSSVIEAIAAGRKAAEAIDINLGGKGDISESLVLPEEATTWLEGELPEEKLAALTHLPPEESIKSFVEVENAFDWNTAVAEAQRCLKCHVITPPDEKTLEEVGCKFCGACVDSCPTGALSELSARWVGMPEREVVTICPYCGVGCQLKLQIKDDQIVFVKPDPEGPANQGQACVKGKFGLDFVHSPQRLTKPLVRKNGKFEEVSWDEALSLIASKLAKYPGDQCAVLSSARCTNEENYVVQKFTRAVLGTNNIDHCARL